MAVISIAGGYHLPNSLLLNSLVAELVGAGGENAEQGDGDPEGKPGHPFPVLDPLSARESAAYTMSATLLPGCSNPLRNHPGTALLVVDSPGLYAPQR